MYEARFLIPQTVVEVAINILCQHFGGCTEMDETHTGYWVNDSWETVTEDVSLLLVFADDVDNLREVAKEIMRETKEEAVLFWTNPCYYEIVTEDK